LRRRGFECLGTDIGYATRLDIGYATRLDRDDSVYVANSVARFRTGVWERRDHAVRCGFPSFPTDEVWFELGPNVPGIGATSMFVYMDWNFVLQ
jgi:hypothetical protein